MALCVYLKKKHCILGWDARWYGRNLLTFQTFICNKVAVNRSKMCENFYYTTCHPHISQDRYPRNHHVTNLYFSVSILRTVERGYNIMKGTEYFVLFRTIVVLTEEYNVIINSE